MGLIWTGMATGWGVSDHRPWWARLRDAWTRNNGQPREGWSSGVDLKEAVLVGVLFVLIAVQLGVAISRFSG